MIGSLPNQGIHYLCSSWLLSTWSFALGHPTNVGLNVIRTSQLVSCCSLRAKISLLPMGCQLKYTISACTPESGPFSTRTNQYNTILFFCHSRTTCSKLAIAIICSSWDFSRVRPIVIWRWRGTKKWALVMCRRFVEVPLVSPKECECLKCAL